MRWYGNLGSLIASAGLMVCAQSLDSFEAAVVRKSAPGTESRISVSARQVLAKGHSLRLLIATSYPNLNTWQILGGPSWVDGESWDLSAKLPPGVPDDQETYWRATEHMLQNFLSAEFRLKTHFISKDQPVYELVSGKGGVHLSPSNWKETEYRYVPGGIDAFHRTVGEFAQGLYCVNCRRKGADRPVIDKSGITGYYDFSLRWWVPEFDGPDSKPGPLFEQTLEDQYGFRLRPAKGKLPFLVIDSAEKPEY